MIWHTSFLIFFFRNFPYVSARSKLLIVYVQLVADQLCVSYFNWLRLFLQSKEECEYLINLAKPHMQKSTVVDSATGQSKDSRHVFFPYFSYVRMQAGRRWLIISWINLLIACRVRTSSGTFLARGRDKTIREIEKRIADFSFIPAGMFDNFTLWYAILVIYFFSGTLSTFLHLIY